MSDDIDAKLRKLSPDAMAKFDELVARGDIRKVNVPRDPNRKVVTTAELSAMAQKVGRCGDINSAWVCTKVADHPGRHEAKQVGGPEDGRCLHWWPRPKEAK